MCIMEFADGLEIHPAYGRTQIAIYFDNDYGLLEEPSRWMMTVAKLKSRSKESQLRLYPGEIPKLA